MILIEHFFLKKDLTLHTHQLCVKSECNYKCKFIHKQFNGYLFDRVAVFSKPEILNSEIF